jgi:hypothetical protein
VPDAPDDDGLPSEVADWYRHWFGDPPADQEGPPELPECLRNTPVHRIRERMHAWLAETPLTAQAMYDAVSRAYRTAGDDALSDGRDRGEGRDYGPLPDDESFRMNEGFCPPPPLSGGWPYHAFVWMLESAFEYPELMAELESAAEDLRLVPAEAGIAALDRVSHALGTIDASHVTRRSCWHSAGDFVSHWYFALRFGLDTRDFFDAGAMALDARCGALPAWPEGVRERRERAWAAIVAAADMAEHAPAGRLAVASLLMGDAAARFMAAAAGLTALAEGVDLAEAVAAIHRLYVAGNDYCAASSALCSPALCCLARRLGSRHSRLTYVPLPGEEEWDDEEGNALRADPRDLGHRRL